MIALGAVPGLILLSGVGFNPLAFGVFAGATVVVGVLGLS